MTKSVNNPYEAPRAVAEPEHAQQPPWWAVVLMVTGAVVLGIGAFCCTCFGVVALHAPGFQQAPVAATIFWVTVAVTFSAFIARRSYRNMVRNYWLRQMPAGERPDMQAPRSPPTAASRRPPNEERFSE